MEARESTKMSAIRGRWGPERKSNRRTVKPSKAHRQEIMFHVDPADAFKVTEKATQLSEFELQEYKDAFDMFDIKDRGVLNTDDLVKVLKMLGHDPAQPEVQDLVQEKNGDDGSGVVKFSEFMTLMVKIKSDEEDEDLREAFSMLDPQHTGCIGKAELEKIMKNLGNDLTEEELKGMIREADTTGDGRITFEEFGKMMKGPP